MQDKPRTRHNVSAQRWFVKRASLADITLQCTPKLCSIRQGNGMLGSFFTGCGDPLPDSVVDRSLMPSSIITNSRPTGLHFTEQPQQVSVIKNRFISSTGEQLDKMKVQSLQWRWLKRECTEKRSFIYNAKNVTNTWVDINKEAEKRKKKNRKKITDIKLKQANKLIS